MSNVSMSVWWTLLGTLSLVSSFYLPDTVKADLISVICFGVAGILFAIDEHFEELHKKLDKSVTTKKD